MTDLVLKAHPSMSFDKDTRERFARMVSKLIAAGSDRSGGHLENLNRSDMEWSVDSGNDWWVFFDPRDPSLVRIKQRYDVKPALMAIGGWLAYRWHMKVMTPELALPAEPDEALN